MRFYSKEEKQSSLSFLVQLPVVGETKKDLFEAMKACVEDASLKMSDCVGFASDGAPANTQ